MRYGTLSNAVEGRLLVLWENLMAELPDDAAARRFKTFDRLGQRRRALSQWQTFPLSRASITDAAFRRSIPVDLVTYLDERYVPKLRERAEQEALPIREVLAHTEDSLDEYARSTPYVMAIVHPYTSRPFLFGSKGIPVTPGKAWAIW